MVGADWKQLLFYGPTTLHRMQIQSGDPTSMNKFAEDGETSNRNRVPVANTSQAAARVEAGEPEPHNHDAVREDEDAPLKVVALALAVHVAEEEDAQDHRHHVPLREDQSCTLSVSIQSRLRCAY